MYSSGELQLVEGPWGWSGARFGVEGQEKVWGFIVLHTGLRDEGPGFPEDRATDST